MIDRKICKGMLTGYVIPTDPEERQRLCAEIMEAKFPDFAAYSAHKAPGAPDTTDWYYEERFEWFAGLLEVAQVLAGEKRRVN